jgi:hypothetical protein
MEPKEKAQQLMDKFLCNHLCAGGIGMSYKQAKRCVEIVIDEILQTNPTIKGTSDDMTTQIIQTKAYWNTVKKELESL